jgi:hypothetical protein
MWLAQHYLYSFFSHSVEQALYSVTSRQILAVNVLTYSAFTAARWCVKCIQSRVIVIRQQVIYQFIAYGHFSSFEDEGNFLPLDRLHKI